MTDSESPLASLERRAKAADITIARICERAKVAKSTPSRWSHKVFEPRLKTLRRLEEALNELIAEKAAAAQAKA